MAPVPAFARRYSQYSIGGRNVNGKLTLGENIADNGGLNTAWAAYKAVAKTARSKKVLPALSLTPDQLFFLSFSQVGGAQQGEAGGRSAAPKLHPIHRLRSAPRLAPHPPSPQVWCNNMKPEAQQERLLTDPHSPGRFRVLGSMANSDAWHDAFSCPRPKETCRLW